MVPSAAASSLLATTSEPANTTLQNYAIPFQNPIITPTIPGSYSAATYTYICTQTGPYLFSVTAAVPRMLHARSFGEIWRCCMARVST